MQVGQVAIMVNVDSLPDQPLVVELVELFLRDLDRALLLLRSIGLTMLQRVDPPLENLQEAQYLLLVLVLQVVVALDLLPARRTRCQLNAKCQENLCSLLLVNLTRWLIDAIVCLGPRRLDRHVSPLDEAVLVSWVPPRRALLLFTWLTALLITSIEALR